MINFLILFYIGYLSLLVKSSNLLLLKRTNNPNQNMRFCLNLYHLYITQFGLKVFNAITLYFLLAQLYFTRQ